MERTSLHLPWRSGLPGMVQRQSAERVLSQQQAHTRGQDAAIIGEVVERKGCGWSICRALNAFWIYRMRNSCPRIC
ncbi:hypothetical protein KXR87_12625 [Yokenella regensburgei]